MNILNFGTSVKLPTVDQVLGTFNSLLSDLEAVRKAHIDISTAKYQESAEAARVAEAAYKEAERAVSVTAKIEQLLA